MTSSPLVLHKTGNPFRNTCFASSSHSQSCPPSTRFSIQPEVRAKALGTHISAEEILAHRDADRE